MKKAKVIFWFVLASLFVLFANGTQTASASDESELQLSLLHKILPNGKNKIELSDTEKAEVRWFVLNKMEYLFKKINEMDITKKDLGGVREFLPESTYGLIESIIVVAPVDMSVEDKMSVLTETEPTPDNCTVSYIIQNASIFDTGWGLLFIGMFLQFADPFLGNLLMVLGSSICIISVWMGIIACE